MHCHQSKRTEEEKQFRAWEAEMSVGLLRILDVPLWKEPQRAALCEEELGRRNDGRGKRGTVSLAYKQETFALV